MIGCAKKKNWMDFPENKNKALVLQKYLFCFQSIDD